MSDEDGQRVFSQVNSGTFFQINCQLVGDDNTLIVLAIFIDGSFVRASIPVKPMHGRHLQLLHLKIGVAPDNVGFTVSILNKKGG